MVDVLLTCESEGELKSASERQFTLAIALTSLRCFQRM